MFFLGGVCVSVGGGGVFLKYLFSELDKALVPNMQREDDRITSHWRVGHLC